MYHSGLIDNYLEANDASSVLPVQFTTPNTKMTPELKLVMAVLEDFKMNIKRHTAYPPRRKAEIQRLAEENDYLESPDDRYLYSFIRCCELLDIDPDYFREKIHEEIREAELHPPARGHMRRHKVPRNNRGIA